MFLRHAISRTPKACLERRQVCAEVLCHAPSVAEPQRCFAHGIFVKTFRGFALVLRQFVDEMKLDTVA